MNKIMKSHILTQKKYLHYQNGIESTGWQPLHLLIWDRSSPMRQKWPLWKPDFFSVLWPNLKSKNTRYSGWNSRARANQIKRWLGLKELKKVVFLCYYCLLPSCLSFSFTSFPIFLCFSCSGFGAVNTVDNSRIHFLLLMHSIFTIQGWFI